jgi:FtsP/CotA-like multicopper oxidase with cupredoxin domain
MSKTITRRDFLKLGGGALMAAAGASLLPKWMGKVLEPVADTKAAGLYNLLPTLHWVGTDGWIHLPPTPAIPPYHPDPYASPPLTTYIFGFRNVTGLNDIQMSAQKMQAQVSAPMFWAKVGDELHLKLTNLGMQMRPDLFDSHTLHWHGFRNAIPFFDGEPNGSISVPPMSSFEYAYRPHEAGTYMYHCHVEDVEHVHMGMTGLVFVRPAQDGNTAFYPSGKYAYDDGDGSTGYDREFGMLTTEVWALQHWCDAHIQLPEWTDYAPDFYLLNGRVYPDTIAPGVSMDPWHPSNDPITGDAIPPVGHPELAHQPISSLVRCNASEHILFRCANLGFKEATMTLAGINLRVVGKDATLLRGRDGTPYSFLTDTVSMGAGEANDVIFTAPAYQPSAGILDPDIGASYNKYLYFNRSLMRSNNLDGSGYGGQMTEVRVFPTGTLPVQTLPNT